ncbi:MAG: zinc ribbon domain-containing protein [Candidatus Aminicenantes bacterium]|nr:zinc ribbon domain-containing protein [Candidatus Aminicenantes bacterium]
MFFLIGGIQPKTVILQEQARSCPACDHTNVQIKRIDHYLSLFFIPLFRVKKGTPFAACGHCNVVLDDDRTGSYPGAAEKTRKCSRCSRFINDDEFLYCPYCGGRL